MNLLIVVPFDVTPDNAQMVLSQAVQSMFGPKGPGRTVHVCVNDTADKILAMLGTEAAPKKQAPQKKDPTHAYAKR